MIFDQIVFLLILLDIEVVEPQLSNGTLVYNPYVKLGAPNSPCWPRGMPLDTVLLAKNDDQLPHVKSSARFGVLQSLADVQPDVDALYRLTQETPFVFNKGIYATIG